MIKLIIVFISSIFTSTAFAANIRMTAPSGLIRQAESAGAVSTASTPKWNATTSYTVLKEINPVEFVAPIGTKTVNFPAVVKIASEASGVVIDAIKKDPLKASPGGLITSVVAAWLLEEGLRYVADHFEKGTKKIDEGVYTCVQGCGSMPVGSTTNDPLNFICSQHLDWSNCRLEKPVVIAGNVEEYYVVGYLWPSNRFAVGSFTYGEGGEHIEWKPATDTDFADVESKPLPADVAEDLKKKGVPIPVDNPVFNPTSKDIPQSDWRTDPLTGKKVRDMVKVTPSKDGTTAEVDPYKQTGDPVVDPTTGEESDPTSPDNVAPNDVDPCILFPNRLGCIDKGEADDDELQKQEIGASISPVSVGGSGQCPADKTISIHGGTSLQFSFKPICDAAGMIKPVVLAIAWLLAGYILMGAMRNE